ncbi:MAG: RNA polymerase sporulation sigma factor SigK [Clostridia bacterium]|nr:RNA polymerase sporulation sigma factor SigK [Clostridia bacterium]
MFDLGRLLLRFISLILGIEETASFPPPLSKDEEEELFEKKLAGDSRARDKLIEHNLRLVSHIIRKYYSSYEYPDELLSIGSLGLIKAVDSFRPSYGTRFATYGAKCVQNEILMFFRSKKKRLGEVSINDTIDVDKDGNPLTYLDIISVEESIEGELDMKAYIERTRSLVESVLGEREREIIVLRYGLCGYQPRTQREVAKHLNISRSYVSRIEKKALSRLKEAFGRDVPSFDDL